MPEVLALLPLLLAPVAALLFMDLLHSRKFRYPHCLLEAMDRRGPASLFFKSFRRRYDVLLDAAMAIVLAFTLVKSGASGGTRPAAVVVDCSRSMLAGDWGTRPLDLALKHIAPGGELAGAEAFALAYDQAGMGTRLVPISRIAVGSARTRRAEATPGAGGALADAMEEALPFFAVDYGVLAELRGRGYGRITLLTDRVGGRIEGIDVVESGFAVTFAAYPTAARYDRGTEAWIVALAESEPRGEITVYSWDEGSGRAITLPASRYAIEEGPGGRTLRFAESGVFLASIKDPAGGPGIELAFRLAPRAIPMAASGPFSERMASVFPLLERSVRPAVELRDQGSPRPSARAPEDPGATIVSAIFSRDGRLILDPATSAGRPIAAGLAKGAAFGLGPSSLANEDLPLAYDAAIGAIVPPAFLNAAPEGSISLVRLGGSFIARTRQGPVPVIPPAQEFFEPRGAPPLSIPPASPRRWGWTLALAAIAAAKLAIWKRLTGARSPTPPSPGYRGPSSRPS